MQPPRAASPHVDVHVRRGRTTSAARRSKVVRHLGGDDLSSPRVRVVDAALRCIARTGIAKTTLDLVAREAGISRATVYRLFPGGKDDVLRAVVETEAARLFSELAARMGEATDLDSLFVEGIVGAAERLSRHEALHVVLRHEPGTLLPHLAFSGMDRMLERACAFSAPFFGRWLEPEAALRAGEWAARIVFAYLLCPSEDVDLTDRADVEDLVSTFVVPGIQALRIGVGTARRVRSGGRKVGETSA